MNNKSIIFATININEENLNNDIRLINSFEEVKRLKKWRKKNDDYKYDNEKEIKEKCKIKINNKKIPFSYCHKFNKKGKYEIEYLFTENLNKADYLFYECNSLINIDLSKFDSQNVNDMRYMFSGCSSLKNIDLSYFNTKNVIDMTDMFSGCESLINIDLSHFNT